MKHTYIILLVIFLLSSCSKEPTIISFSGDTLISETIGIDKNEILSIAPGSTLRFAAGATIISNASIVINGTEDQPITLIGQDEVEDHWIMQIKKPAEKFELSHIVVENGLITSNDANCHFKNVKFTNDKDLEWNSAAARFWDGSILIEECTVDWNRKGEGFLIHDTYQPVVRNCTFSKVGDAVEYLGCIDGEIRNCTFLSNSDDAIDLNNCDNVLLVDNQFFNTRDRAMEIGSEGFGNSTNIKVSNNLFVDCNIAISVKENSDALIENATIVRSEKGLEIINEEDNGLSSSAEARNSVIVNSKVTTYTLDSHLDLNNCMSDDVLIEGSNTIYASIEFADSANNDYRIISPEFPIGMDEKTMGYQKK